MKRPSRYKLVLVNNETGKITDSRLKGADMLSEYEATQILKRIKGRSFGWHYKKVRLQ